MLLDGMRVQLGFCSGPMVGLRMFYSYKVCLSQIVEEVMVLKQPTEAFSRPHLQISKKNYEVMITVSV